MMELLLMSRDTREPEGGLEFERENLMLADGDHAEYDAYVGPSD